MSGQSRAALSGAWRARSWRLLDTGVMSAAGNIALDSVLLDMQSREEAPSTLRFLQFEPSAALIGRHQAVAQEIREEFCRERGIDINRRITGGGAVFFDATQIGWEIIALRREISAGIRLDELTERICLGVIEGLKLLGISGACFRPRNDIEVNGRKIAGTGGAYEGEAFLFQGTLLVDFDAETMIKALKVPTEKLARHELDSARKRVTCLGDLLPAAPPPAQIKGALAEGFSRTLGVHFYRQGLSLGEKRLLAARLASFAQAEWVNQISEPSGGQLMLKSAHKSEGGIVRSTVRVDISRQRIKSALFTGDFFLSPARAVLDLEARLKDVRFEMAKDEISRFFSEARPEALQIGADDFWLSLSGCLAKLCLPGYGIPLEEANYISMVGSTDFARIVSDATVLLLPYCAKLPACEHRNRDGCGLCGECSVGGAYGLAASRGLLPVTVHNYEHLSDVFAACRRGGVSSFIGCCCHAFLVKHHNAFHKSGLQGVIVDIDDATCYELAQEEEAYRGRFHSQTSLRLQLLEKVLDLAPPREKPVALEIPISSAV